MTGHHRLSPQVLVPPLEQAPHDGMHRRGDDLPVSRWKLVAAVLIVGAVLTGLGVWVTIGAGNIEDQRDATAEQAQDLGRDVTAACARGEVVQSDEGRDLCQRAAQIQSEPVPGVQGLPGEPGRPPTPDEIRAVVNAYMAQNPPAQGEPGRPPTPDEVAAAVAQYLTANPPQPGRPPTSGEIADAVATYFATNPPPQGDPGQDGQDGEQGRPPTAEEIQAAVDAYLAQNPPPEGPPGPAGPTCIEGTHLETVQFADSRFGLACVLDEQPDPDPTTDPEPTSTAAPTAEPTMEPEDDGGLLGG